jgi:hypothetical protein
VDVFGLTARARERRIRAAIGEAVDSRVT